jgi:hypothetical protein
MLYWENYMTSQNQEKINLLLEQLKHLSKELWNKETLSKRAMVRKDILRLTQEVNDLVKQ